MKNDLLPQTSIAIPEHELEITTSRAGGPGGQHVNKTDTRITVRWNVKNTSVLSDEQKERVLQKLQTQLTIDGDLIIHSSESRSQLQNKQLALQRLTTEVRQALHIPKKRKPTRVSKRLKEVRLDTKKQHGRIKKMRSKKVHYDE